MDFLPKELKKIIQTTQDSLKSFEYIIMVMDERIKVEENYLNGLNKIQGQLNYIKEADPLSFECSALKVDVSQRAGHNQYLIEQMKSEQDEMKQLNKKSQEKMKDIENNLRESEKTFKQIAFDLEKQKEKLTQASKESEDLCLYFQLIETDVGKNNPKWKEKKTSISTKLKTSLKAKQEQEQNYKNENKVLENYIVEYNRSLVSNYDELVKQQNSLKNSINDLARKQLVFEVNQIRNIQYDLDNVIKQVDSRPNFAYTPETVTLKLNPHKILNFQSFFTPFLSDIIQKASSQIQDLDQTLNVSSNKPLPAMDSNFDCIPKEERSNIQHYFQKGIIDNLNQLSVIKNKKFQDSCHYLLNSVLFAKGDCIDLDVINSDISIIQNEITVRTQKNQQLYQEEILSNSNQNKQDSTQDKEKSIEEGKQNSQNNDLSQQLNNNEVLNDISVTSAEKSQDNLDEEGKKLDQVEEKQLLVEEKSETQSERELKDDDELKSGNVEIKEENIKASDQKQEEGDGNKPQEQKNQENLKDNQNITESPEKLKSTAPEIKEIKQVEQQEVITVSAPVFFDYKDEQNQAIFLIFLENFRQSGKSQISPQQFNQLVVECFRYLDDLFQKKDILQLIKFMPLTFAIYRLTAAEKVFIQEKVKHHFIWTQNDVWETIIFRSVNDELQKLDPSISDDETVYRNTVYSNLAIVGLNMLKFRSTKQTTKNLLGKLCMYYGLLDQQTSELVNFIENEGQNEKSLSFVKNTGFTAAPNMTKGRIVNFGQSAQQQQNQTVTTSSSHGTNIQETKVNPLLQKTNHIATTPQSNNQPRQFQSTFTPTSNQSNIKPGSQTNPLLSSNPNLKHTYEIKHQNQQAQEMNTISKPQEGSASKIQPTQVSNQQQQIPAFANQQVPIQAQVQQSQKPISVPTNKVNSKLFGSGQQDFSLNNKK